MTRTVLQEPVTLRTRVYSRLLGLHDLWIVLAWGGLLAGLFLYRFYNRDCFQFVVVQDVSAPCITELDWFLVFVFAVGAGMSILDERVSVLGFLLANIIASGVFVFALLLPPVLAGADAAVVSIVAGQAAVLTFNYEFPFSIFFSLVGGLVGMYVGSKLPQQTPEWLRRDEEKF